MKYIYAVLASGLSASASVLRRQIECDCSFQVDISGGPGSGPLGQYTDGQNRVGPGYDAASYCLNGDTIVDSSGRGCILTSPTTQFQCDSGATATPGFTIACGGVISYNGNSTFWECAATGTGVYNIYTSPGGTDCYPVTLTTVSGACGAPCSTASAGPTPTPAPSTTTVILPPTTIIESIPGPTITSTTILTLPQATVTAEETMTATIVSTTTAACIPSTSTLTLTLSTTQIVTQAPITNTVHETQTETRAGPTIISTEMVTPAPITITIDETQTETVAGPTIISTEMVTPAPITITATAEEMITNTIYETQTETIPGPTIISTEMVTPAPITITATAEEMITNTIYETQTENVAGPTVTAYATAEETITAYMTTTVVSILVSTAPGGTITITGPGETITGPGETITGPGETITGPGETITVTGPGETITVTGPGETMTVTGPGSTMTLAPTTSTSTQVITTTVTVSSSSTSSCPTDLSGEFQYPHLIIPVNSSAPDTAYGMQYFGTVTPSVSSIFNFDIPASYAGHTCSLIFLLPNMSDLQTSSYTLTGTGSIVVTQLSSPATASTTYDNQPSVNATLGTFDVASGSSTLIVSGPCAAGETVAYELSATGSYALSYFQDYNPAPVGLYITEC